MSASGLKAVFVRVPRYVAKGLGADTSMPYDQPTPAPVARINKLMDYLFYWLRFGWTAAVPKVNWLELTFHTAKLREICEKRVVATAELGYAAARELADRLADIEALDTVADLSQLLGEAILDRSAVEKSLRLNSGFHVVFISGHPSPAGTAPKSTAWEKTTRMKITAIELING